MTLPTVVQYFSRFQPKAPDVDFPPWGLMVKLRNGDDAVIVERGSSPAGDFPRLGLRRKGSPYMCWNNARTGCSGGSEPGDNYELDIIAVYKDGKLIATNEP
jgi:hypothetical protein